MYIRASVEYRMVNGEDATTITAPQAVQRRRDQVVCIDEEDLAVLGEGEEAQFRQDVCPACRAGVDPVCFEAVDDFYEGAVFGELRALA